jgi:hypothetical protein
MNFTTLSQMNILIKTILLFALIIAWGQGNAQFFNSPMDHAQSLGKGNKDLAIGIHQYRLGGDGFSGKLFDNISLRFGVGVGDNTDIQLRYERIKPEDGINFVSITPKFSFADDALAFFLPIGLIFGEGDKTGVISPTMMYTKRGGKKLEGSLSIGSPARTEDYEFLLDINAGFGISNNLDKWAVRPELGIHFQPGESSYIWHFGVAFSTSLSSPKAESSL